MCVTRSVLQVLLACYSCVLQVCVRGVCVCITGVYRCFCVISFLLPGGVVVRLTTGLRFACILLHSFIYLFICVILLDCLCIVCIYLLV